MLHGERLGRPQHFGSSPRSPGNGRSSITSPASTDAPPSSEIFEAWNRNKNLTDGYIAGDAAGNLFFAAHVILALVLTFGGALQLVPKIRSRALAFHRWNGRVFLVAGVVATLGGLY